MQTKGKLETIRSDEFKKQWFFLTLRQLMKIKEIDKLEILGTVSIPVFETSPKKLFLCI
jgi:hypothetical protein